MKICLVGPFPPYKGGISKYNFSLATELSKHHEMLLISYSRQYPAFLISNREQKTSDFKSDLDIRYKLDSINPFSWIKTIKDIIEFNPDIVILPWWTVYWAFIYCFFIDLLNFKKIKVIILCHNVFDHEENFIKQAVSKFVLKKSKYFLVHSDKEKNKIYSFNKNCMVIKHLHPLYEYPQHIPAKDTNDLLNLLFFGFVREYKGLDLLLEAVARIKYKNIKLTIVGEFWQDKEIYERIIEKNNIKLKVEIIDKYVNDEELDEYFVQSDLIVLPYKQATSSGVIATAYGYNKPVLVTDVGGLPEAVEDELTGKIVSPSAESIAKGIIWFIENKNINFDLNIEAFKKQKMSWESLVSEIEKMGNR